MSTRDRTVSADSIKTVLADLRQRGPKAALNELAEEEPALAAWVIYAGQALAEKFLPNSPESITACVQHECILQMCAGFGAMRRAHYELWRDLWEKPHPTPSDKAAEPPPPQKVSALAMARRRTDNITVVWTAEDVRRHRPGWSGPEAQFFLDERRDEIGHALLEVGLTLLGNLIEAYEAERRQLE